MGSYFEPDYIRVKENIDGRLIVDGWYEQARHKGAPKKKNDEPKTPQTPEERANEIEIRRRHKAAEVEDRLIANSWEYTIVLTNCKKHDAASQWDNFKNQFKKKHKLQSYLAVPVDFPEKFLIVAVVSGVPADVMRAAKYCSCEVIPFELSHIEPIKKAVQYRAGLRSYFPSRKLIVREGKVEKAEPCEADREWESVTGFNAVISFDSWAEFEYWKKTGKRMESKAKEFDNVLELAADADAMKGLLLSFQSNVDKATKKDYVKNAGVYGLDSSEFEYRHTTNKRNNTIEFAAMQDGTIVLSARWFAMEKEWDELRWNVFPTVYYWQNIETGELIYGGLSATPISRHTDHIGNNAYEKSSDGVLKYMQREGVTADKLKALYLPVGWYKEKTEYTNSKGVTEALYDGQSPKFAYITTDISIKKRNNKKFKEAEARLQRTLIHGWKKGNVRTDIFLGENYSDVMEAERVFWKQIKDGKSIDEAATEAARGKASRLKDYLEYNAEYLKNENQPLEKCMEWWEYYFKKIRKVDNKKGFVKLDVIAEIIRQDRVFWEDVSLSVFADEPETKEKRLVRHDKLEQMFKKENEKAQINAWTNEFD